MEPGPARAKANWLRLFSRVRLQLQEVLLLYSHDFCMVLQCIFFCECLAVALVCPAVRFLFFFTPAFVFLLLLLSSYELNQNSF